MFYLGWSEMDFDIILSNKFSLTTGIKFQVIGYKINSEQHIYSQKDLDLNLPFAICVTSGIFFLNLLIFYFLAALGLSSLLCTGFSSWGAQVSHPGGFSLCRAQALGLRASLVVVRRFSCSMARGIFPDQRSNPWPLHWQVYSQALDHQGSPICIVFNLFMLLFSCL